MEGQYITPMDLSNGFEPTNVTFGVNFPGCEGKLEPIKVRYHNTDWFEPGRTNNFRQFQQSSDVNSHLAPMCVCVNPWRATSPIDCTSNLQAQSWKPPAMFAFNGFVITDFIRTHIEATYPHWTNYGGGPDYDFYEGNQWVYENYNTHLAWDIGWNAPNAYSYRFQRNYDIYGYEESLGPYQCLCTIYYSIEDPDITHAAWHFDFSHQMTLSRSIWVFNIRPAAGAAFVTLSYSRPMKQPFDEKPCFGVFTLNPFLPDGPGEPSYEGYQYNVALINWVAMAVPKTIEVVEVV